jgi:hypothetical protein
MRRQPLMASRLIIARVFKGFEAGEPEPDAGSAARRTSGLLRSPVLQTLGNMLSKVPT